MLRQQSDKEKHMRRKIRRNRSVRENKYNLGGIKKDPNLLSPPVTLVKLKFMEGDDPDERDN